MSSSENQNNISSKKTAKRLVGPKFSDIWKYFIRGNHLGNGHYQATCEFCSTFFKDGRPHILRSHIALQCLKATDDIKNEVNEMIINEENLQTQHFNKRAKSGQQSLENYFNSANLEESRIRQINEALVMMFIMCALPFRLVENPFFINLLKALNPGYQPPSRKALAGRLLDNEVVRINKKINKDLKHAENLTLGNYIFINFL
jgi:hypothetical protein